MAKETSCRPAHPTTTEVCLSFFITERLDDREMVSQVDAARGVVLRALVDFRMERAADREHEE
ncbi:MAG TPA: hypothetical protein VMY37_12785 [Thermoguttaceae bacterium]|nr:hypothetical protein [Thermoguttaceae bacterium]